MFQRVLLSDHIHITHDFSFKDERERLMWMVLLQFINAIRCCSSVAILGLWDKLPYPLPHSIPLLAAIHSTYLHIVGKRIITFAIFKFSCVEDIIFCSHVYKRIAFVVMSTKAILEIRAFQQVKAELSLAKYFGKSYSKVGSGHYARIKRALSGHF